MATHFQVRIAHDERTYAAQAAQDAFDLVDSLESRLSRFRINSDICQIAHLEPGAKMRLSEPAFACLANREADGAGYAQRVLPYARRIKRLSPLSLSGIYCRTSTQSFA